MSFKIAVASLGCAKNLVDTENMLGILLQDGHQLTIDTAQADIIIVNTCGFIGDAKKESIDTILEMAEYKQTGQCKALIVTGCLAERYKEEILDSIEEVDAGCGIAIACRPVLRLRADTLRRWMPDWSVAGNGSKD